MKVYALSPVLSFLFYFLFITHVNAEDKVLIYMHGSDMHGNTESSKQAKNYKKVIKKLNGEGFEVIFEFRTERDSESEARRTADKVKELIASGHSPENIIVGGFSYGSMISLKTAGLVSNDEVNYALFCGCPDNPSIGVDIDYQAVKGNVLSIVDKDDQKFGSCEGLLPNVSSFKEVSIRSGKGHKVFKLGKEKFLRYWVPHLSDWAGM